MVWGGDEDGESIKYYVFRPDLVRRRLIVVLVFTTALVVFAFAAQWVRG